jgi:hypothetical protein
MTYAPIFGFLADQRGGGTIMGLLWFVMLVGICGLAVDSTNGFRAKTMLQATADATSLAAAIDLPNPDAALATAVDFAAGNMDAETNGSVLDTADVHIGLWNPVNYTLDTGAAFPDAVMVTVRQTEENSNPVPVNFLRIIGLMNWNVEAQAVAQRFIPECLRNELVARGVVDISSNNGFVNRICIHGQQGVEMQNHNFHELGVTVSMPDVGGQLVIPTGGMESNPGLPDALREQNLDPRMVNHVDDIMDDLLLLKPSVLPDYIDPDNPVIVKTKNFDFTGMLPKHVYHIDCKPNQHIGIPQDTVLTEVVIVADCQVGVGSNVFMHDVALASRTDGKVTNANINMSSGVVLGLPDGCASGGGVQIFTDQSVHFSSTTTYNTNFRRP